MTAPMMHRSLTRRLPRPTVAVAVVATLAGSVGCDFKVTNPGPVEQRNLDSPVAFAALVNGAGRDLSEALNWISYTGAAVSREVFPGGSTGTFGITVQQQRGKLTDEETNTHWNLAQRARWTAESGVARFRARMPAAEYAKSKLTAQMLLWTGYANRLLGENMCDGVIDGGPRVGYTVYLTRAEAAFTEAMTIATNDSSLVRAARAGRASVRADRNNWAGAVADAGSISNDFVYQMPYFSAPEELYNRIYFASANEPYRAHTTVGTYYDTLYTRTNDRRIPWGSDPLVPLGDGAVAGVRPKWHFQLKFPSKSSPINLSSGWEMKLIIAEALLVGGDFQGAVDSLNVHRALLGLQPIPAPANAFEAGTALKRERGIELWLEGRRLGDLRRWRDNVAPATPGDPGAEVVGRDVCFPIARSEKQTNPNLTP